MGRFLSGDMSSLGRIHLLGAGAADAENRDECRLGPSSHARPALGQGSAAWVLGCRLPAVRVIEWIFRQPPPHLLTLSVGPQSSFRGMVFKAGWLWTSLLFQHYHLPSIPWIWLNHQKVCQAYHTPNSDTPVPLHLPGPLPIMPFPFLPA